MGCKLGINELAEQHQQLTDNLGRLLNLPKWAIDSRYFRRFHNTWPKWDRVPPHAQIQFDAEGEDCGPGRYEFYLPEAVLYEDMCFAYNNAVSSQKAAHARPVEKKNAKAHFFYLRNAVLAGFYFVEAYLNGVAFDYLLRSRKVLMTEEADLLPERDSKKGKGGLVAFERKIKEYPKVILGLQHPPLTESNCAELKFLLNEAKDVRDAIVHQSPRLNPDTLETCKLKPMVALELNEVTKVVDAIINFVRKLNEILGKHGQDLSWLVGRSTSGIFPDKAFE